MPVRYVMIVDSDDTTVPDLRAALGDLPVEIIVGTHHSKTQACNCPCGEENANILMLASDDMWCVRDRWDELVASRCAELWPNFDGCLRFFDGYQADLATFSIMGRRWWQKIGRRFYREEYRSLFCDNEYDEVARAHNRMAGMARADQFFEHRHPNWGVVRPDATYQRNDVYWDADQKAYHQRKAVRRPHAASGFDMEPVWLSVMIPTLRGRAKMLAGVLAELNRQIDALPEPIWAEIVLDIDDGETSTGLKRNRLVEKAVGRYVAFVDDDDMVDENYVRLIVDAVRADPSLDCIGMTGRMTTDGANPVSFRHTVQNQGWFQSADGVYQRSPNHLNPVRRDLALKVKYPDTRWQEDFAWSEGMRRAGLLRNERMIDTPPLYHYRFRTKNKEAWHESGAPNAV